MTTQIAAVTAALIASAVVSIEILHSPRLTPEDVRESSIRVYFNEERGYFAEARLHPDDLPIYTELTELEATSLRGPEPDPALIAKVLTAKEPVDA